MKRVTWVFLLVALLGGWILGRYEFAKDYKAQISSICETYDLVKQHSDTSSIEVNCSPDQGVVYIERYEKDGGKKKECKEGYLVLLGGGVHPLRFLCGG